MKKKKPKKVNTPVKKNTKQAEMPISQEIGTQAPHFDTPKTNPSMNTNVEISKETMDDSTQTDSRPAGKI